MTRRAHGLVPRVALALRAAAAVACGGHGETAAPPPPLVISEQAGSVAHVDHPERFPVVTADRWEAHSTLSATGVVSADINRAVPVQSLASGRIVELRAKLGDEVREGQVLLRIRSADISSAFSDYRHALADEILSSAQLERSKLLFDRGAIAQKDLEVAQDTEDKAKVDVETTAEHLVQLGMDPAGPPTGIIDIRAPVSGIITEQNVTNASGVKTLDNSPNLFTISDLSRVWIVCDVYENDLPTIRVGDGAEIRLNAYPDRPLEGRVDNILPTLDPTIRTAKVRVEVANPGIMKIGMFVTAVFHGQAGEVRAAVPATAVLHLHDREWVYVPSGPSGFQRVEVVSGEALPRERQEIRAGLKPGQSVVQDALVLQNTVEQ